MPRLSQDQREERLQGIGASESAMLLGLSPFGGPGELQARKLAPVEAEDVTWVERLGQIFESAIAEAVTERKGWKLRAYRRTIWHPSVPYMFATPDFGIVGQAAGLEIKKSDRADDWGDDGDPEGVPVHYRVQVEHQMACIPSWSRVWVAVLLFGRDLRLYPIDRNPEQIAHLEKAVPEWYEAHVLRREPIDPDGTEGTTRALRALYPKPADEERIATAEEELIGLELVALTAEAARVRLRQELLRQQLMRTMGPAPVLVGKGWRATWKLEHRRINWEQAARDLGATDADGEAHRPPDERTLRVTAAHAKEKAA